MAAGAIGFQIQVLLLDLVFHLTAHTIKVFITFLSAEAINALLVLLVLKAFCRQVGHDKTRIVFVLQDLDFRNDAASARPALKGLILELGKAARHPAAENGRLTDSSKFFIY